MNSSYNVALVSAVVLCLAVLGYFITSKDNDAPDAPEDDVAVVTPAEPAPREIPAPTPPPAEDAAPAPTPTPAPAPPAEDLPDVTLGSEPPTFTLNPYGDGSETSLLTDEDDQPSDEPAPAPSDEPDDAPPPSPPPGMRSYTVKPGDTFTSISTAQYGSDRYWADIAQANPLKDPIKLRVGDVINLPDLSAINARRDISPDFSSGPAEYLVRPGDNLEIIARRHYNDPALWRDIYRANRTRIGPNPDRIQVGMKLIIPPAPRGAQ